MNSFDKLMQAQQRNSSILCVGLDPDINKLPINFEKSTESILKFNLDIIDATAELACAYKINFAFFEQYGLEGFNILKKTFEAIPKNVFTIADAKRGDIGNTSAAYAKSVFEYFGADSITVSPYMGNDSIMPFLEFKEKIVFILALTSNSGSKDFQRLISSEEPVYKHVIRTTSQWGTAKQIGYVIGATHPDELSELRTKYPENCFLIPGIGAQGGDIEATMKANQSGPAIVNVSRSVLYASSNSDYAAKAREQALQYKNSLK